MADSDFDAPLTDVRLEVDVSKLERYLSGAVPELAGAGNLRIKQFGLGTSNPTYLLWSESRPDNRFVVRRKPPGCARHPPPVLHGCRASASAHWHGCHGCCTRWLLG